MTRRTTDAFVDVNRVIEICEVRQVVHTDPLQWLARLITVAHWFQIRAVGPNLFVAIHADGGRRNAGRGRRLNRRVAITTVDAVVADVVLMTELDWLLALDPLAGVPTRSSNLCRDPKGRKQNKDGAVNRSSGQIVRTVTENLWHLPKRSEFV